MRALLKSNHLIRTTIIDDIRLFSQKPGESLDNCCARFESIVTSLHSYGPLTYSDNECAKQLLYALDDSVWGMKITTLEESTDFAILDTEKLFSKLKSHKLSRKGHPNHDASLTSMAFITSARVGGHDTNPTNTTVSLLAVIKCIYLPPTYLHFIQDIEYRCLLLTSSTSFVDLPFQEHRMMESIIWIKIHAYLQYA
jgi:hypothetical protein